MRAKSTNLPKTVGLTANHKTNTSMKTIKLQNKPTTFPSDNRRHARQLKQQTTTTTTNQQRRDNHQRKRQIPMMTNKRQTSGRHPDYRRQRSNNCDQKPTTSNRYDALADELVNDGITIHQPSTTDERTPTNQRPTWTTATTITTGTHFIGFHPKSCSRISFDSESKTKDKRRCTPKFRVLSPTLQLDRKHKMLNEPLRFTTYETSAFLDTGAVQSATSEEL